MTGYDTLYQEWIAAKRVNNFLLADEIRDYFEREEGITIYAEGDMLIEGITCHRMSMTKWYRKFRPHDLKGIEAYEEWESKFGPIPVKRVTISWLKKHKGL